MGFNIGQTGAFAGGAVKGYTMGLVSADQQQQVQQQKLMQEFLPRIMSGEDQSSWGPDYAARYKDVFGKPLSWKFGGPANSTAPSVQNDIERANTANPPGAPHTAVASPGLDSVPSNATAGY